MNPVTTFISDDDIPTEIDFSKGERGKFFKSNAVLHLPVYLDVNVQESLADMAAKKGVELSTLANDLLKRDLLAIDTPIVKDLKAEAQQLAHEQNTWEPDDDER